MPIHEQGIQRSTNRRTRSTVRTEDYPPGKQEYLALPYTILEPYPTRMVLLALYFNILALLSRDM